MKRSVIINILILFTMTNLCFAEKHPKDHKDWWLAKYGALEPNEPFAEHIRENIFSKVRDAADKSGSYPYPELLILKEAGNDFALCLQDGTIILTQKAIDICYQGTDRTTGDARVAFVLGHEFAHLSNGDFFCSDSDKNDDEKSNRSFMGFSRIRSSDDRKEQEHRADLKGLLFALLAGYDPQIILEKDNFFQKWQTAKSDSHSEPEDRLGEISTGIQGLKRNLDLFYIGTRLYQLEKYDDALKFLEAFNKLFPSREVYNNIGLIYYQKAMRKLAECDYERTYRFKLTTLLDTRTRADLEDIRVRSGKEACKDAESLFEYANRHFRNAGDKDIFYVPSRINYSSALIMTGKYATAKSIIEDEIEYIRKDYPSLLTRKDYLKALNNLAIAMYLYGPDRYLKADMFDVAFDMLNNIIKEYPNMSDAYYNLARIEKERKRIAAKENWKKYLSHESVGIYADMARKELGEKLTETVSFRPFSEPSPVRLGKVDDPTYKTLTKDYTGYEPNVGTIKYAQYYTNDSNRVLILAGTVDLAEAPVIKKITLSQAKALYGEPSRKFENSAANTKTLVYHNFALDFQNDMAIKVVHFGGERWVKTYGVFETP